MSFFKKDISNYALASFAMAAFFMVAMGGGSAWVLYQNGQETLSWGLASAAIFSGVLVLGVGWAIVRGLNRHLGAPPDEAIWTANKISQGNLSIDIKVRPDDQASLVFALNKMRNSLTELVGQVRQGADTVAHTSTELAGNNSELSARTEDLVDALQQTNATIEQLTATIQQNADNAIRANQLADAASVSAASGGEVVSKAVTMMSELNQSSKKIVEIISVIDAIAFQTNLLALNATVEAAHAGELGRGFAIVASEVRNLAQRSASAAKEIRTLITNSVSKIENGTHLVNHAGERISELVSAVSDVRIVINEINIATQEQSQGLQHINGAVAKIDAVAQQNAAMVQSASEAAESLQDQAGTLAQLAGVFKLSNSALENVATKQPTRRVTVASGKKGQDGFQARLIRFGYGLEEQSNQGRASRFFAQDLAQRTGGKLKLKEFGNATLGNDDKMQQALIEGELEMMVGSTATLVKYVQDFGVFDLPFVFTNEHEADTILDGQFGQELIAKLESKGLIGLVYWENGFRNLTNNVRPIKKMGDLKNVKLRVMQNPLFIEMFNIFGAQAVPLPFAELYAALESKKVDGQENPVNTIQSSKFYEVQKYLSLTKHVYSPWIVTAGKKWWDSLSSQERQAISASAVASRQYEREDSRQSAEKAMTFLKDAGMKINVVDAKEINKMRDAIQGVVAKTAYGSQLQRIKSLL